jgi:hypothetical protein
MRAQAATFERLVNEKVETIKTEAANKAAAAESAAAAKASEADKAVAQARAVTEKFTSPSSGKTVVDFSIFRTQAIDGLVVRTGWKYQKADDPAPSSQWCYIEKTSLADGLHLQIATDGSADPFNPGRAAKAGVTWSEVQKALPYCDWFKGAKNISVIDGIEAGLEPHRIRGLLFKLKKSEQQVFATTHSPVMLRELTVVANELHSPRMIRPDFLPRNWLANRRSD